MLTILAVLVGSLPIASRIHRYKLKGEELVEFWKKGRLILLILPIQGARSVRILAGRYGWYRVVSNAVGEHSVMVP